MDVGGSLPAEPQAHRGRRAPVDIWRSSPGANRSLDGWNPRAEAHDPLGLASKGRLATPRANRAILDPLFRNSDDPMLSGALGVASLVVAPQPSRSSRPKKFSLTHPSVQSTHLSEPARAASRVAILASF